MMYLVLSFSAFLFSVFAIMFFSKNFYNTDSHRGTLADLSFILNFLSTTDIERTELKMAVLRRVTWLDVVMTKQGVTVELPLVTKQQLSRKEKYIAICEGLGAAVLTKHTDDDGPLLVFGFSGDLDEVSAALKHCFAEIFDIENDRKIEFTIHAKRIDQTYLAKKFHSETNKEMDAIAPSSLPLVPIAEQYSVGLATMASNIFLRPVIILLGLLYGGFIWFCVALMVWIVLSATFKFFYRRSKAITFKDVGISLALGLIGFALWSSDQTYVQLIPSVSAGIMITETSLVLLFKTTQWPVLSAFESTQKNDGDKDHFGLIALGLAIILCNEYLRNAASFETWAWVYAFAPAAFIAGTLALAIPIVALASLLGFLEQKEAS